MTEENANAEVRIAELEREIGKLKKINGVLMTRVERSMDMQGSAFSLFQAATALEGQVQERTKELRRTMDQLATYNDQLLVAKESADAANVAKSRFLATMSHEIRTPLNGVLGVAEVLQSTRLDHRQRSLLDTIVNSGQALLSLINDILDLSRIESGKLELSIADVSPLECLESVCDMFAVRARAKNLELIADIDPGVPDLVKTDVLRLRQVLVNLIGNALKFTEHGAVEIRVRSESKGERAVELHFEVRDTGIGIPHDKQDRIFEPFTQADASTTRQHGGTGLGLAICKRLVELMGGSIGVTSTAGVGSNFVFTILAGQAPPECRMTAVARLPCVRVAVDMSDPSLFSALDHRLVREGATVIAGNGAGEKPQIVLTDRFERASSVASSVPVLVLTHEVQSFDFETESGRAREFLLRPAKSEELIVAIRRLCAIDPPDTVAPTISTSRAHLTSKLLRMRVLLVEDNEINRAVACEMLDGFGCTITTATNGVEAIDTWTAQEFDAILMDFQMPVMDGITATERIRAAEVNLGRVRTSIIALTANAFEEDRRRAEQAGCDAFLTKPISRASLFNALEQVLRRRKPATAATTMAADDKESAAQSHQSGQQPIDETVIDMSVIREVVAVGTSALLNKLVAMYAEDSSKKLDSVREAYASRDPQALFAAAHGLKSTTANLGGRDVIALCKELETCGRQGRIPDNDDLIDRLATARSRFYETLQTVASELAA